MLKGRDDPDQDLGRDDGDAGYVRHSVSLLTSVRLVVREWRAFSIDAVISIVSLFNEINLNEPRRWATALHHDRKWLWEQGIPFVPDAELN